MPSPWLRPTFGALLPLALIAISLAGCTMLEVAVLNRKELTEFQVVGDRLYMAGEINSRTLEQFHEVMETSSGVETLVLTVVPGSLDDEINLQLGLEVRKRGLATHVPSGGMIASGGVDLFLAGVRRNLEKGAYVGVHSWATGNGSSGASLGRDHPAHRLYLDYYEALEIPADFYWFTLESAPVDAMHWMTADELERFAMITQPVLPGAVTEENPFSELIEEMGQELAEGEDSVTAVE
ncbi:MAG: alpha/beta hydrolase [Thermoanaerobaculia bacterium]|nr:alpha/beta hydrolase [Thermoanaerobaculia bacterium]